MEQTLELFPLTGFEKLLNFLKLRADTSGRALFRGLVLAMIAWGPMAAWSLLSDNAWNPEPKLRFFNDFAAYAQFWIGFPLLCMAQVLIGRRIAKSVSYMKDSGFITLDSQEIFQMMISRSQRLINFRWLEIIILIASYVTPLVWLSQELTNGIPTWHGLVINGIERPTFAGIWEGAFAIPLFWFLIYRWIWRVFVWSLTLYNISRLRLNLKASHPDSMGGLGFISAVQANFGILIFVFGCVIASTTLYKIIIEKAEMSSVSVWGMVLPFMIIAPIAFIAPLLVFTPSLLRLRMNSQYEYSKLGIQYTDAFERKWIKGEVSSDEPFVGSGDIQSLADLGNAYEKTMSLKIVPFDFQSMLRLVTTAFGPMIPVIIKVMPQSSWIKKSIEMFL